MTALLGLADTQISCLQKRPSDENHRAAEWQFALPPLRDNAVILNEADCFIHRVTAAMYEYLKYR